jgi:3-hydroxybutyryl-CoA dehydrogenase
MKNLKRITVMKIDQVKRITVLGAGTMGTGLALVFARGGYPVSLYSRTDSTLDRALAVIRSSLDALVTAGEVPESDVAGIMGRIETNTDLESVCGSDLFIETVAEKLDVKQELYKKLDALCPEHAVIASNTSFLNIFPAMPERRLPNTAIAHFFAPAHIVPLVEVVRGEKTTDETIEFLVAILRKVNSVPVVIQKYVPGFCINRIQSAIGNEVYHLLDNGYMTPEDIDLAVKASFIPRAMVLGLVQRYDFTGINLTLQNLKNNTYKYPEYSSPPKCLTSKAEQGNYGVASGKGFYDYSDRSLGEVLKDRDVALLRVLSCVGDLIHKHV